MDRGCLWSASGAVVLEHPPDRLQVGGRTQRHHQLDARLLTRQAGAEHDTQLPQHLPSALVPVHGSHAPLGSGGENDFSPSGEWRLGGDLGRRYAAVSGDRNPIHMHSLTAKAFGFPRAIAHGMWTKARCLAALESRLPDAFAVAVRFRKPILLPTRVEFASAEDEGRIEFAVRDAKDHTPHLEGSINAGD